MKIMSLIWLCALFLSGCSSTIPEFNGEKAFEYLEAQCEFGPRNPGSKGHAQCKDYFIDFLNSHGATVSTQEFPIEVRGEQYQCTNIVASYYPEKPRRIFIGAHWDTRPWADRDADVTNHNTPIAGANDAASGVAVLMNLQRYYRQTNPRFTVLTLFFLMPRMQEAMDKMKAGALDHNISSNNIRGKSPNS